MYYDITFEFLEWNHSIYWYSYAVSSIL